MASRLWWRCGASCCRAPPLDPAPPLLPPAPGPRGPPPALRAAVSAAGAWRSPAMNGAAGPRKRRRAGRGGRAAPRALGGGDGCGARGSEPAEGSLRTLSALGLRSWRPQGVGVNHSRIKTASGENRAYVLHFVRRFTESSRPFLCERWCLDLSVTRGTFENCTSVSARASTARWKCADRFAGCSCKGRKFTAPEQKSVSRHLMDAGAAALHVMQRRIKRLPLLLSCSEKKWGGAERLLL